MSQLRVLKLFAIIAVSISVIAGQSVPDKKELGSRTAKDGFKNETAIAAKFNDWKSDVEAQQWLAFMGYKLSEIQLVTASKPHGEKADVLVRIKTRSSEKNEGISIKLVTTKNGFNQIDKRWLNTYARIWKMPPQVVDGLRFFVGELPPDKPSRDSKRMFLNELDPNQRNAIVDFFTANKREIVSDIFSGDGEFGAGWMIVASVAGEKPQWVLRKIDYVVDFFSDGPVEMTRQGNLKIGRITMQRKGGDGGRDTAKMLQFKINPALLFPNR